MCVDFVKIATFLKSFNVALWSGCSDLLENSYGGSDEFLLSLDVELDGVMNLWHMSVIECISTTSSCFTFISYVTHWHSNPSSMQDICPMNLV